MSHVIRCQTCDVEMRITDTEMARGKRFCSRACYGQASKLGEKRECVKCGDEFYVAAYRIERGEGKFCSERCMKVGNQFALGHSPANKGKPMSDEQRAKLSAFWTGRAGPLCNAWKGGRTIEGTRIRSSLVYRNWRTAVFERDDYTCQNCGERGGHLHADHIKPFASHPGLRFDVDNGRTLCVPCHRATPTWGFRGVAVSTEA